MLDVDHHSSCCRPVQTNKYSSSSSKLSCSMKIPNLVAVNIREATAINANGNNPTPNLPVTNEDGNTPKPWHVLSIYDVYENLFRHYSARDLRHNLEELLEDMTKQAAKNGKLAAKRATGSPQAAGLNEKQRLPKTSSTEWKSAMDEHFLTKSNNNPFKRPKGYDDTDSSTESLRATKQSQFLSAINGVGSITTSMTNTTEDEIVSEGSNTNKDPSPPLVIPQTTDILSPRRNTEK